MMAIHTLRIKINDSQSKQILTILETSAKRGAELVSQVLSFGRGREGNPTVIDLKPFIFELEKLIRETFPRSIETQIDLSNDLWSLSMDITQLHQVLMNLCVNARDAMPSGGRLKISAKNLFMDENYVKMSAEAKIGPYIVISVSDSGTGIPPAIIDKIFDPFFTSKEFGKGTGLGLSTSMGIIRSYGGFIHVYSEVGRGTEFKIFLPAIEVGESKDLQSPISKLPSGNGELILVVDDEYSILEITRSSLEAFGYRVLIASDGTEAIAIYVQNRDEIDVVLTDLMMPLMDGKATIRALQRLNPQIKIIASTGLITQQTRNELLNLGVKYCLSKPFTAEELLVTLQKILHSPAEI
jgi:two-component system, cell cycle sensor histidine kinase and response regulator CckA